MLSRRFTAVAAAVLLGALLPGTAQAAPPSNDDFDTPTAITALPFTTTIDATGATTATDDPRPCDRSPGRSVWLRYTAPADAIVTMSAMAGRFAQVAGVFTGTRGALTPVPQSCAPWPLNEATFHVEAGTTYHVLVSAFPSDGPFTFDLRTVPTPANDARSGATTTEPHTQYDGDLRQASAEPGEVTASCAPTSTQSLWYRFTPATAQWYSAKTNYGAISIYRVADLSEVDCLSFYVYNSSAMFSATPGETYLIRVAAPQERAKPFKLELGTPAPFVPVVNVSHPNATVHTDVRFSIYTGDERRPLRGTFDFGDGHTEEVVPGQPLYHRYAADGDYTVTATGSLSDGRTGTGTAKVHVETHDVTVSR